MTNHQLPIVDVSSLFDSPERTNSSPERVINSPERTNSSLERVINSPERTNSSLEPANNSPKKKLSVDQLGRALRDIGFVAIQGHGLSASLIVELRSQIVRLFGLSIDEKMNYLVSEDNYRGYIPLGFFTPNAGKHDKDFYEAYKLHTETDGSDGICQQCSLYGPNKWPAQLPELKVAVEKYWRECDRITLVLLKALAEYLGLSDSLFDQVFNQPLTNMTLLHYPAADTDSQTDQTGIHPHKDTDVLTILAAKEVDGLLVRQRNSDKWIEARAPDDALIVNVGDMLEIWSGGVFVSTPHKVVSLSARQRYSFPYFAVPRFDCVLEPLACDYATPFKAGLFTPPKMQAGDVSKKIWQSNWPDGPKIEDRYDPYIS